MKTKFINDYNNAKVTYGSVDKMVVAVKLPTGFTEIIVNTEGIGSKVGYYDAAYDGEMCLRNNSDVQILAWMFVG